MKMIRANNKKTSRIDFQRYSSPKSANRQKNKEKLNFDEKRNHLIQSQELKNMHIIKNLVQRTQPVYSYFALNVFQIQEFELLNEWSSLTERGKFGDVLLNGRVNCFAGKLPYVITSGMR
jgi:hypothetical protein